MDFGGVAFGGFDLVALDGAESFFGSRGAGFVGGFGASGGRVVRGGRFFGGNVGRGGLCGGGAFDRGVVDFGRVAFGGFDFVALDGAESLLFG